MAYLQAVPLSGRARTARRLAFYGRPGGSPSLLHGAGWRRISAPTRRLRGLGQDDSTDWDAAIAATGGYGVPVYGPPLPDSGEYASASAPGGPLSPSYNPSAPLPASISNAATVAQPPAGCALCYATPQAAIAAGVNPSTVAQDWGLYIRNFSSPQAAVAAGIPAGVVTQYWNQGGATAGIPSAVWWIGGGLLALVALGGGGRR